MAKKSIIIEGDSRETGSATDGCWLKPIVIEQESEPVSDESFDMHCEYDLKTFIQVSKSIYQKLIKQGEFQVANTLALWVKKGEAMLKCDAKASASTTVTFQFDAQIQQVVPVFAMKFDRGQQR